MAHTSATARNRQPHSPHHHPTLTSLRTDENTSIHSWHTKLYNRYIFRRTIVSSLYQPHVVYSDMASRWNSFRISRRNGTSSPFFRSCSLSSPNFCTIGTHSVPSRPIVASSERGMQTVRIVTRALLAMECAARMRARRTD
ncbi:unnamed protein product [Chondrus crispus]|uniref:Uncharacterized protein n=1 Tax=Chondrus crispus TaxID=2769 RepID=R7QQ76_CHOCR|nr:unnamed protein product [Chondrus crispus]CDF39631.1 unnamed protein product [Chondrus crispus]|eukprot:XP_005709925.1 unnamed protein product [Chondrus crispus]